MYENIVSTVYCPICTRAVHRTPMIRANIDDTGSRHRNRLMIAVDKGGLDDELIDSKSASDGRGSIRESSADVVLFDAFVG